MDNHLEEEKLTKFRQTIRVFILPLLEEIYNKAPMDIIAFCCDYFQDLSQREDNINHLDTHDSKYVEEVSQMNQEKENTDEVIHQVYPNLQGSSSEPILTTSEKGCKGKTARGTSSWILPPSHPYRLGSCRRVALECNPADAMSSTDDQQSPKDEQIEFENAAEAGDTMIIQKGKAGENDICVENDISSQVMTKPTAIEGQSAHALTSVPIYDNSDQKLTENPKEKDTESPEHGKFSDAIEETKICFNNVSPNSSCGFIPHLSEYSISLEEEFSESNSECYDDLASTCSKTTEDIQKLTKGLSATLQSLAQDFRHAENNLDAEFQNAKEISDVIRGRRETKEGDLVVTEDPDEDNGDDQYTSDSHDSKKIIDESWKKRWYDAHPLDSTRDGLKLKDSILFRGCNIVDRNRRNEAIRRIGEAGDIPKRSSRNPFTTDDLTGCLASSLEKSREDASSPGEEDDSSNVIAGEILDIRRRVRPVGATRNLSDKDILLSIPSQSIPYSWRHLCKPRASSLERKETGFTQFKRKLAEENLDSANGIRKELNANTSASHEPENAPVVVREAGEHTSSASPNLSKPISEMVEKQGEPKIHAISEDNASKSNESEDCENKDDDGAQAEICCIHKDTPTSTENEDADGGNENQFKFQRNNDDSYVKEDAEIANKNDNTNDLQQNESSEKIEPGLMSAGGDFAVSLINENNEQNIVQLPREECIVNNRIMEVLCDVPREEGPEEMIEVGTEQQNKDSEESDFSFEGLNFSTYSESDGSDISISEDDYDSTSNV